MPIKKIILVVGIALLCMAASSFAQVQEAKEYKVQQGDTLWDISKKELNDPFLWPKVWKENPGISNPDKLMPGQIIKIPLHLIQKEEPKAEPAPEPVSEAIPHKPEPVKKVEPAPARPKPLVDVNLFISSGYISPSVNSLGSITDTPSGRVLLSTQDMVFVKTVDSVRLGDRLYILRKGQAIKHPVTKASLGTLMQIVGIAEIKKFEYGETIAQIIKTYDVIKVGDLLDSYSEMNPPVVDKPYRKPDINGYIVETRNLKRTNGSFDVVYIDMGRKDGIEAGDVFKTVAVGKHKTSNGQVQIINVLDSTSVALVRNSTDPIEIGNKVTKAD